MPQSGSISAIENDQILINVTARTTGSGCILNWETSTEIDINGSKVIEGTEEDDLEYLFVFTEDTLIEIKVTCKAIVT